MAQGKTPHDPQKANALLQRVGPHLWADTATAKHLTFHVSWHSLPPHLRGQKGPDGDSDADHLWADLKEMIHPTELD